MPSHSYFVYLFQTRGIIYNILGKIFNIFFILNCLGCDCLLRIPSSFGIHLLTKVFLWEFGLVAQWLIGILPSLWPYLSDCGFESSKLHISLVEFH